LRSSSEKLLERILAEARANAFKADIVALPELELSIMIKRKLLARYEGLENSIYPEEAKDPGGYWTGLYTSALFYDFLLSRSGMETIRASRRIPTRPDVTATYLKPYNLLPFEQSVMDDFDKYVTLFRDTFKPAPVRRRRVGY
jgi:hypothetical protein